MIIYFYLFIPLLCRLVESSSIKGRNHKNDLVPFLSSRLDTQKDNSLKIVSNEPFIIQFQMPPESKENVHNEAKIKDKKKKRPDKKRISKIKPLRRRIRTRRDVSEAESRKEKPDQSTKLPTEVQSNQNQAQNFLSRQEILKALNIYLKKKETKKIEPEETKNIKNVEKPDATSGRNLHRNHSPSLPYRQPHVKMIYPKTPKSDSHNYSYKDLIADRERLEQKINYIKNMLDVNDSTVEDPVRIRRKSDSDNTANKIAKMFLTLSAMNGLHEKKSKCKDDDDDRVVDVWEKERKISPSRQSSSSNEERYKIKKWIEYMKNKRSSSKTCPCMDKYNEENDNFPLEQKLTKDNPLTETGTSSEEHSDKRRDPLSYSRGRLNKSGPIRNNYKEDARSKLRALTGRGRKKYDLPIEDLELYRSRAKQILQNAEEILDKIKEEEEKRLAGPQAIVSRLRELTSRIQGDPRSNENDLINVIKKNLGWTPQSKSQSSTDNNSFVENMKSFILDPYEKAKALTDESTRKLSSYLLRNLGKIDSSEQEEAAGKSSQRPQVFHGQVPQTEEMFSANLAKENPESDLLAKEREEHQNWSDTLSAILGGNGEDLGKENTQGNELKQTKGQEESIKRRMEEMINEQEKQISEHTETPKKKIEETTIIDLMTGNKSETFKESKQSEGAERVEGMLESEKRDENVEESKIGGVNQNSGSESKSETVKSTARTGSDVMVLEHQLPQEEQTVNEKFAESVGKRDEMESEDGKIGDFPLDPRNVKAAINGVSIKEGETIAKNLEDGKKFDSKTADENRDEDVRDVVKETVSTFEKGIGDKKEQALESPQKQQGQDDNVEGQQGREENNIFKSKHLVQKSDEQNKDEKLEAFTEEIQKLLEKNNEELPEETSGKPVKYEKTIVKTKDDFSEMKDPEEKVAEVNSSPDSVKLQKETTSEEIHKEFGLESNAPSNGVVQASHDPKESLQYKDLEKDKPSIEKENSAKGLVEGMIPEKPTESFRNHKKTEDSAEGIVEKVENSVEIEKERMDVGVLEKAKSIEVKSEKKDTMKSNSEGAVKKDNEKVREEFENDNVREELGDEDVREELDNDNVREESDDENVREESDDEKVREESNDEKVREELDNDNVREESDDENVREESDDEKVREESNDEKVREELDNDNVREELDDEKVREELDDEKVREESNDEKVREELDNDNVREESDDEKVREELDDEKVREESDDEKVREESDDEKVREELDDEKVREESDDEKVREELDNDNVREESDDEKVRKESDDDNVREESDDEKVRKESDDDNVREESDDEKVREESDDEKVREELDDEKVREELDDENVREISDDENVREESDDEKVREESNDEKVREELDDEKVREELDDENVREISDEDKVREESNDEKVRKKLNDKEKGISKESSDDAERDETNQEEPSLRASLEESDNEPKSSESFQLKFPEESRENADESADGSPLRLENPEKESLENSNAGTSLKASKQSQEENEVDGTENDDGVSLKASKPQNTDEIQDTIVEGNLKAVEMQQENKDKDEPQVRAELKEMEETDMNNKESPLRLEHPDKNTDLSNESLMNTSGSQEKVEAIHDETVNEENSETKNKKNIDETLKATAVETDKDTEEMESTEVEKVEQPKETENIGEYSRETDDESLEINKTPKLLMSIKKYMEDEEDEDSRAPIEDPLNASESDNQKVENKNMNKAVPVKAAKSEAYQEQPEVVQNTQEMDEEDDVNVRAENIKDLDNHINEEGLEDGELKSAKAESEELNEDGTAQMNSLEQKDFDKDDVFEGVKHIEPDPEQILGKKENAPASEAQSQSRSSLKVPKSIGKIMKDLDGKEKDDYVSLIKLNPEKIDHIIDKIDEAEHLNKVKSDVDCRKECACADEMNIRSRNIGRYEIAKDFLRWVKDLQLNRVLTDD